MGGDFFFGGEGNCPHPLERDQSRVAGTRCAAWSQPLYYSIVHNGDSGPLRAADSTTSCVSSWRSSEFTNPAGYYFDTLPSSASKSRIASVSFIHAIRPHLVWHLITGATLCIYNLYSSTNDSQHTHTHKQTQYRHTNQKIK